MNNLYVVIPAIKKNATIPDQLIKKLNGITLIQRAINTSLELTNKKNILILTDSQEISLISERNGINFHYDKSLTLNSNNIICITNKITENVSQDSILIYRANAPLVNSELLKSAYEQFSLNKNSILTSVKKETKKLLYEKNDMLVDVENNDYFEEIKAFLFFSKNTIKEGVCEVKPFILDNEKSIEIESYQDWWVCEKVLQRKRIIFNVIGSIEIGMGHIYHSLALAHEITDHEIIFVCDEKYKIVVDKIAAMDYKVVSTNSVVETILDLKPHIVINDILNTQKDFIENLKRHNIKVVNFEDLGEGSHFADLVFNELYDVPQIDGKQYLWGYKYLALRDEFYDAKPHEFLEDINEVLITFGGTDQNNLTLRTLKSILTICKEYDIHINIVCGSAYVYKNELEEYISDCMYKKIIIHYASDVISKIMERTQLAISSNGRTVYELADMNIPSIIISHHERENTHTFAQLERGFINLQVVNETTDEKIEKTFLKLVDDRDYRELLFMNIKKFSFRKNKQKVVKLIMELLWK